MSAWFDHEKLDVYQAELEFVRWVNPLLDRIRSIPGSGEVRDQLDRASLSALLNTAEGNGKRSHRMRAKFFDDARGSSTECAACLDALVAKGLCAAGETAEGKELLLRITSMLTRLVERFAGEPMVRDRAVACRSDSEHEHEYEYEERAEVP